MSITDPRRRWLGGCLAAALLGSLASCSPDEDETSPVGPPALATTAASAYDIVKVASIAVDGNLKDWAGISSIAMADDPNNQRGPLNNTANVKLAWNDTYLYAAYDVKDTDLRAEETARDAWALYKDDEVELYIDPQGDGGTAQKMTGTDYHLLASVRDVIGDMSGNSSGGLDSAWNAPSFAAKSIANGGLNASGSDVGYTVELQVAWADLGITPAAGKVLRIDPAVGDRDGPPDPAPPVEEFDWAGLNVFNNPSGWKDVQLVVDATAPAPPTNASLTVVSSSEIDFSWTASPSTDVAKYKVYRATTGSPSTLAFTTATQYQDTQLMPGTTYTYQVAAVDPAGNISAKTQPISATTDGGTSAPGGAIGTVPRSGDSISLAGNSHRTSQYDANYGLTDGSRIYAGLLGQGLTTWTNTAGDPAQAAFTITRLGDGADISWQGGYVLGSSREDGSVPWDHDSPVPPGSRFSWDANTRDWHSQAAMYPIGLRLLVDQFSAYAKGDGVALVCSYLAGQCEGSVIRFSALEHMHDDAVEDDGKDEITLYQNYLSGFVILSTRPAAGTGAVTQNASGKVVTLDGNLMRLVPLTYPDRKPEGGTYGDPLIGALFKWQVNVGGNNGQALGIKAQLRNNIILIPGTAIDYGGTSPWGSMPTSGVNNKLVTPSNNVILFPDRTSGFPPNWPSGLDNGFAYIYGAAAKARWNSEIDAWMNRHPKVKVTDPGKY